MGLDLKTPLNRLLVEVRNEKHIAINHRIIRAWKNNIIITLYHILCHSIKRHTTTHPDDEQSLTHARHQRHGTSCHGHQTALLMSETRRRLYTRIVGHFILNCINQSAVKMFKSQADQYKTFMYKSIGNRRQFSLNKSCNKTAGRTIKERGRGR